ncbi:MAG TPA: 2-oxoacid:acceptor oxidoreductase family protein [Thermodesulfobacteriota bacterium]|jgi:2-oxoglutarate ferredoxin oxidoreductase subunit gamma|nr:2-oxoacid:acceptor oxidoreductase family protein [Thermodesulfobacteriota bacterium]
MGSRYEIRLSGSGGQGLILMGIILAEAIGVYDGKHVAQTQSYGPEARGGSSKSEVIVSDEEIDYPKAMELDLLLAMNQKSCDEFFPDLKPEGILIVDSTFVTQVPTPKVFQIPFTRIAREKFNREVVANIIALGALSQLTPIVSAKAIESAVLAKVPKGTEKLNRDALRAGMNAAKQAKKARMESEVPPEVPQEDLLDSY